MMCSGGLLHCRKFEEQRFVGMRLEFVSKAFALDPASSREKLFSSNSNRGRMLPTRNRVYREPALSLQWGIESDAGAACSP